MKNAFVGYYAPSEDDYKRLWTEGLIVLDTNVVLDLYRLPASARDEMLSVLEILKDRLWIPYHVALEYQRRRLLVIAGERKTIEDALSVATNLFAEVEKRVTGLQIDKRGLDIDVASLIKNFEDAHTKLVQAISTAQKEQLDIAISDPIRQKLDAILVNRVGPSPKDQAELDVLINDGSMRYDNRIPPGYADVEKDKNPNEANFYHDGICYPCKFGDLILWRQLLSYAKEEGIKTVLLVTSDQKEDWWWREKGKTIGPRPELAREALAEGGVELFWMYSSVQFLESAKTFTAAKVSDQSLKELNDVNRDFFNSKNTVEALSRNLNVHEGKNNEIIDVINITIMEESVASWLMNEFEGIYNSGGFPNFILENHEGRHGFEVKYVRDLKRTLSTPIILNLAKRARRELREGGFSRITLLFASTQNSVIDLVSSEQSEFIRSRLANIAIEYGIHSIIAGIVDEKGDFRVLFREPDIFD